MSKAGRAGFNLSPKRVESQSVPADDAKGAQGESEPPPRDPDEPPPGDPCGSLPDDADIPADM